VHGAQTGRESGSDVVVDTVADVGDLTRSAPGELDDALEEPRVGLPDAQARGRRHEIDGKQGLSRPPLEGLGLISDDADEQSAARTCSRQSSASG
jgi:hypothetical protein